MTLTAPISMEQSRSIWTAVPSSLVLFGRKSTDIDFRSFIAAWRLAIIFDDAPRPLRVLFTHQDDRAADSRKNVLLGGQRFPAGRGALPSLLAVRAAFSSSTPWVSMAWNHSGGCTVSCSARILLVSAPSASC